MGKPDTKNNRKASKPKEDIKCTVCSSLAGEDSIECNECQLRQHVECTDLPKGLIESLAEGTTSRNLRYVCDDCIQGASKENDKTNARLKALETKVEKMSKDNTKTNKDTTVMKDIVQALQQQNTQILKQNEEIQKQNMMIFKMFEQFKPEAIESNIKAHVKEITDTKNDTEERRKNLIVFRLEEDDDEDKQTENDVSNIVEILKITQPDIDTKSFTKENVFRLGPKRDHIDKSKPKPVRPIKIKFQSFEQKMNVLKNARKLRDHPKFGKVGLQVDMTKAEQEDHRALVLQLKDRKSKGEDVMIYNGECILKSDRDKKAEERRDAKKSL